MIGILVLILKTLVNNSTATLGQRFDVKHEVQRGILVPTRFVGLGPRKLRNTLVDLAGVRIFLMQTDF
jgi:hypothetical protein